MPIYTYGYPESDLKEVPLDPHRCHARVIPLNKYKSLLGQCGRAKEIAGSPFCWQHRKNRPLGQWETQ